MASIENAVLYVKGDNDRKFNCNSDFLLRMNCVYYGLKSCIFVKVEYLRTSGRKIYSLVFNT